VRVRREIERASVLIAGAALIGAAVACAPLRATLGVEEEPGGLIASLDESIVDVPEVWLATEDGDVLPSAVGAAGVPPVPAPPQPSAEGAPGETAVRYTRIPAPSLPPGPRRIGIQAGHWMTGQAPPELSRLMKETGAEWAGVTEVEINLDIARRVEAILEGMGFAVDVLPTTIPQGYTADAVVALHGDSDGTGKTSGFKLAHGSRRTPYEAALLDTIKREYAAATGLGWDAEGISRGMGSYFAFAWQRTRYTTAPHTPSVVLEMGFISHAGDRTMLTRKADVVAGAIARGIVAFLEAHPRERLFGQDLLVPVVPQLRLAWPSPSP
jgi:N-acetylmuramoyl-L-alanine amidase